MNNVNLSVLFLVADMPIWLGVVIAVVCLAIGGVAFYLYKLDTEKKVGSATERVRKMEEDAKAEADRIKAQGKEESKRALKEALLEAKEQDLKLRNEFEREAKEKKAEMQRMEQRLTQKEDAIDKKAENLEQQKANLLKFSLFPISALPMISWRTEKPLKTTL